MSTKMMLLFFVSIFLLTSCGDNKEAAEEKSLASNAQSENKTDQPSPAESQGDGIVGTWKLHLDAFDRNENQELEGEERKKGVPNNNTLQFKADGTCRIQNMFNGTYTIKEEGGKKLLTIQRKKVEGEETEDPQPDKYYIKSVTKDELVLLVIDGGGTTTFWIFNRV